MKYKKEIDRLLRTAIYEDWMSEDEYEEIIELTLKKSCITKKQINEAFEQGVKMGYTIEEQFIIVEKLFKPSFE